MYNQLATLLSQTYNININAFDINTEELEPVTEDVDLLFYENHPIENTTITGFRYKEPRNLSWKCIQLDINPNRIIQVAELLNSFIEGYDFELIDLNNLRQHVLNYQEFQFELYFNGLVFILLRYSLAHSFIDITIPSE